MALKANRMRSSIAAPANDSAVGLPVSDRAFWVAHAGTAAELRAANNAPSRFS